MRNCILPLGYRRMVAIYSLSKVFLRDVLLVDVVGSGIVRWSHWGLNIYTIVYNLVYVCRSNFFDLEQILLRRQSFISACLFAFNPVFHWFYKLLIFIRDRACLSIVIGWFSDRLSVRWKTSWLISNTVLDIALDSIYALRKFVLFPVNALKNGDKFISTALYFTIYLHAFV